MENHLVLAALLILAIVAFFYVRSRPKDNRPKTGNEPLASLNLQPRPRSSTFNADTSSREKVNRVIVGRAYVTDGDSIVIDKTQIRLFGIDAPELGHPFGQKAKWALVNLCKGQTVRAEIHETDDHGRTVAHCTLPEGRDLSAEMVKCGLAIDWLKYSKGKYRELEAHDARKRMWLANARQKGHMHVWQKFEDD